MTAQTAVKAQHATLTGGAADSVTFSGSGGAIRVRNRSTSDDIYFRLDGVTAVSLADDNYLVGPGESVIVTTAQKVVSLISAGNAAYSVELY